jgi:heat-inducible transcriptional repressor
MVITPGNPNFGAGALASMNNRSREIFRSIVDSYLATGEPVGSRHISRLLPITLSPASIRNVMQDLEELGLVYAPHTSAGRLPTEIGLRFFVDAMLEYGAPSEEERQKIEAEVKAASQDRTIDGVLAEASSLLSGLTRGAGVVKGFFLVAIALAQQIGGSHGSHAFTLGLSVNLYPSTPAVRSE